MTIPEPNAKGDHGHRNQCVYPTETVSDPQNIHLDWSVAAVVGSNANESPDNYTESDSSGTLMSLRVCSPLVRY